MKNLFVVLFFSISVNCAYPQLVINEIMQSNIDCIMDDMNEFPDSWVELYNAGSGTVNLRDYSIGVFNDAILSWTLPSKQLEPGEHHIVYCDKVASRNHTDFRLESGKGCELYLFEHGTVIDNLPSGLKKQPAPNIAYGRKTDGSSEWGYMIEPTPGQSNCGQVVSEDKILGDPVFSMKGRVYRDFSSLTLKLSLPEGAPSGSIIRYTTNYTEPTEDSEAYTGPITITGTTIIRAKVFCPGYLSPRSVTHSYIKHSRKVTLPVVSITTPRIYFYDPSIGIYSDEYYSDGQMNYEHNWRRPANFEYFENAESNSELNQLIELRVCGGANRNKDLRSLAIYANKRFGEKKLDYEFFPDERPRITDYKSIMMRNSGNDFRNLYMRDAIVQRSVSKYLDVDHQAWSPAILYIDGQYKGILNIRERSNEDNIYSNYEKLEDVDVIEYYTENKIRSVYEVKQGSMDNWNTFKTFFSSQTAHSWADYEKYLDIKEYLYVMIANIYFCNHDFLGNNVIWWRPTAKDGKWRMIMKDIDYSLGLYNVKYNYNYFRWLHDPDYDPDMAWGNIPEATLLFRQLELDSTFKREFIDRFALFMGDFLNYERIWETWEPMYDLISYEYKYHRNMYDTGWWTPYSTEMHNAKVWLQKRTNAVYDQLKSYYGLGYAVPFYINRSLTDSELSNISVSVNGIRLSHKTFSGKFFAGRNVSLTGKNVKGWAINKITNEGYLESNIVWGDSYQFNMPDCFSLSISAVLSEDGGKSVLTNDLNNSGMEEMTGIEDVNIIGTAKVFDIYDMSGKKRDKLESGINILVFKDGTNKIIQK